MSSETLTVLGHYCYHKLTRLYTLHSCEAGSQHPEPTVYFTETLLSFTCYNCNTAVTWSLTPSETPLKSAAELCQVYVAD